MFVCVDFCFDTGLKYLFMNWVSNKSKNADDREKRIVPDQMAEQSKWDWLIGD